MGATLREATDIFLQADPLYACGALGLYILSIFIIGLRWNLMIQGLGGKARVWQTSLANLAGIFVNNVTPASRLGGEACRIALIRKRDQVDLKTATVSSIYDRLVEVPSVATLFILSLPVLYRITTNVDAYVTVGSLLVVLILISVLIYRRFEKIRNRLQELWLKLSSLRVPMKNLGLGMLLGVALWLQDIIRLAFVALAFGVSLDLYQVSALAVLMILGGLVPTVGGLGAIEGGMVGGLVLFGVDLETAIAITALERSISYVFGTCAGGATLAALGGRKIFRAARSAS